MVKELKFNLIFQGLDLGKSRAEIARAFYERFKAYPSEGMFVLAEEWVRKEK